MVYSGQDHKLGPCSFAEPVWSPCEEENKSQNPRGPCSKEGWSEPGIFWTRPTQLLNRWLLCLPEARGTQGLTYFGFF